MLDLALELALFFVQATYHGKHPDGRLRITIGKQKALLHGVLYRLTQKSTASGKTVTKRRLVHTTPGHQPEMLDTCNLIAIGTKTSHRYRIIGKIELCEPKLDSAENSSNHAPIVVLDAAGTPRDAHISRDNRTMEKRTQRHLRVLQRELECLQHQLKAGLDPMLSIALAIHITGRSRATLYRDFGKALHRNHCVCIAPYCPANDCPCRTASSSCTTPALPRLPIHAATSARAWQ